MTAASAASAASGPITRDDIEQSFRAIQTGVVGQVKSKRTRIIQAGSAVAVVLVLLVFLFGKRAGRKRSTIVEIRRV